MAASRIFVRGLPPSLTEDDFRKHFSLGANVTDLQLKSQRRIGYVGFETHEAAVKAVKFFHKSFIRMSRLHVELAQEISHAQKANRTPTSRLANDLNSSSARIANQPNSLKRKRYDDRSNRDLTAQGREVVLKPSTIAAQPDLTYGSAAIGKVDAGEVDVSKQSISGVTADCEQRSSRPERSEENESALLQQDASPLPSGTDADWMKSRTTRLLGLADDESENDASKTRAVAAGNSQPVDDQRGLRHNADPRTPHVLPGQSNPTTECETEAKQDEQTLSQPVDRAITAADSGRMFLRNLAYNVSEDDLRSLLDRFGPLQEIHVPLDFASGSSKGFAFAEFLEPSAAQQALEELDGTNFQGRLLHILPSSVRRESKLDEFAIAQLPLKKRKLMEKKTQSLSSMFNWNSMYMNADAVVTSAAARLGIAKSELLDPTSSDAAVKQAQIETHTIQEAKRYFESNGVDLDSLNHGKRDGNSLLVKNFKYDTTTEDLTQLFSEGVDVKRILMPPSGTIAIIEFQNNVQAKTALTKFAYRKYKDSVLFLERAPSNLFKQKQASDLQRSPKHRIASAGTGEDRTSEAADDSDQAADDYSDTSTLFVRNLNFSTTSDRLQEVFRPLEGLMSARVKTRPDTKHEGQVLSMGFGFLEFRTNEQARAAFLAMNGYLLDGHEIQIKASHKGLDAAADRRREDNAKRQKQRRSRIIIKNLPFEASKKDVRSLFGSYGQVKAVRLPRSSSNTSRGYAFADFTNAQQAERAMELGRTHLLGRKLVLEYAAGELADPEKEIEMMQEKIGRQSNSKTIQQLTANKRRKFNTGDTGEDDA